MAAPPAVRFSAIIPTYNRADYVAQAIESALAQRVDGGVEVIVVDDGSTDATPLVVERFGSAVTYLWQANRREGAARNQGASHARGAYLAFLDSDDFWLPGKLAADLARFEQPDRPVLVYSRGVNVDAGGRRLGVRRLAAPQGDVLRRLARESFVPMSSVAVRADAFRACGGFNDDPALSGTADWELWMRLAARGPVGFVDQAATCIRVHPANMSGDNGWMERAMLAGVRYVLADPVIRDRLRGQEGQVLSHMYVTVALRLFANAAPRAVALRWLWRALRAWPPQAADPRFLGAAARLLLGREALTALRRVAPRPGPGPVA